MFWRLMQIPAPRMPLQSALEATVVQLGSLAEIPAASAPGALDRMLAAGDAAVAR